MNTKIKYYPNFVKIISFNYDIFNNPNVDYVSFPRRSSSTGGYEIRSDSLKRSKDKVFDIVFLNDLVWRYFVTLTLDSGKINRYDDKDILKKFKSFLRNSVSRKDLSYIFIPEYHQDGAIHFHGLISDCNFTFLDSGILNRGKTVYNIKDWKYGFSSAIPISSSEDINLLNYITKYINKDAARVFGNYYFAGGNILRECQVDYFDLDFDSIDAHAYNPFSNILCKYQLVNLNS